MKSPCTAQFNSRTLKYRSTAASVDTNGRYSLEGRKSPAQLDFDLTDKQEKRLGFEALGILSGQLHGLDYHLNLGGGVDRSQSHPFMLWGMIVELPISETIRLVGEINGEAARGTSADSSALIGFIWNAPLPNLALDAGIRRGISRATADWMFTTGLTFSFSLSRFHN